MYSYLFMIMGRCHYYETRVVTNRNANLPTNNGIVESHKRSSGHVYERLINIITSVHNYTNKVHLGTKRSSCTGSDNLHLVHEIT
jgi:hypothetical protein